MRFACGKCGAQYMIADEKIGNRGVKVRCKKCTHMNVVRRSDSEQSDDASASEAPLSPAGVPAAASASLAASPSASVPATIPSPSDESEGALDSVFGETQSLGSSSPNDFDSLTEDSDGLSFDDQPTSTFELPSAGDEQGASDNDLHSADGESRSSHVATSATPDSTDALSTGRDTEIALGSLEQRDHQDTGQRPTGEKEWYVAIDDCQVGPIDIGEVEQRWDEREIDEESLAWKAGMAGWIPVAEVAELAYLITERPQRRVPIGAGFGSEAATLGAGSAAGAGIAAASFDVEDQATIDWKPSAASALSSLVEEEIVEQSDSGAIRADTNTDTGALLQGMPSLGADDTLGAGVSALQSDGAGSPSPLNATSPTNPVGGGWSVPDTRRRDGNPALVGAVILLSVVVLAALAFGGYYVVVLTQEGSLQASSPTLAQANTGQKPKSQLPPPPPDTIAAEGDSAEGEKPAADEAQASDGDGRTGEAKAKGGKDASERRRERKREKKSERNRSRRGKERRSSSSGSVDDVFEERAEPAETTRAISKRDIIAGVQKHADKLTPCINAARSKGEILPGKYRFVFGWRIQPTGGVSGGELTGPPEVMGSSLPACFSRVMSSWKFPPSKNGAPIRNFPLTINVP